MPQNDEVQDEQVNALIDVFDATFAHSFNTRLVKGTDEPVYLPANEQCSYHQIVFANGFFASALHEIAHRCIAGSQRRLLVDYGYWYCPDGRNHEQQSEFEQVEIKPQAIEWAFTLATGRKFSVSTDNLNGAEPDRDAFSKAVKAQLQVYFSSRFPPRAETFITVLQKHFLGTTAPLRKLMSEAA